MKNLRLFASVFSIFGLFFCCQNIEVDAQETKTAPQIAKVTTETKTTPEETSETETETNTNPTPSYSTTNLTRIGVQTVQTMPLTLNEAIRKAMENNNDIEVAKNDVRIAESNLRSLLGIYDGVINLNPNFDRNSTTGNTATNDFRINSDFTKEIKQGGGNYRVFFNNLRTENRFAQQQVTSGSGVSSGGATYSSSFGVTYTQPLWRNFRVDQNRRQIKIQRKRVSQSDADFRRQAITTISQVQQAYWDLVFALRDQQNRVANLNLSKENLRQVEAKIKAGTSAPLDRAEVETELANRESDLLLAVQQVSAAENRLKQLILRDPNSLDWSMQIVPTDQPVFSTDPINLDAAMADAMQFRPELNRLRLEKDVNKIDVDYFRNQTKPRVDLVSTLSLDGLALGNVSTDSFGLPLIFPETPGLETSASSYLYNLVCSNTSNPPPGCTPIPTVTFDGTPNYYRGGFSRSLRNFFRSDAPNFTVGVTISFPLRNTRAKADLATARLQSERIDAQTRSQEQAIMTEVRDAVQAVETARQRVLAARRARENAETLLEGERKKYEFGRSTTFFLFQRENTLTNARNAEIRAETDYNKAIAELQRVTSTTFRANNIDVESPMQDK